MTESCGRLAGGEGGVTSERGAPACGEERAESGALVEAAGLHIYWHVNAKLIE